MSGSGWKTVPNGYPGGSIDHFTGCLETLSDVQEWSGGTPGFPGVVVIPSQMYGSGGWHSRMSGTGQEALPDVREWSGGNPCYPGVIERPSRMSGSGRKTLPNFRVCSGDPPEYPRVVWRPSRMSESGRKAHPDVLEW